MPREHYEELDFNLAPFGFDEITLQIWGKESLRDSDPPGTKTIDHGDREIVLSPALQAVFVNEDTDETLTFSITGTSHNTHNSDGSTTSVATGRNILGDQFDNEVVLTIGRFTYTIDADGNPSPLTGHGQEIALLALLDPIL
ncbi:hypothetical protein [Microvirga massiliensis]|uniref:hypothetical protein n=1 Tax=Microvirga massiliensis TaxID=1033741 RepID=UPI00062B9180|nr:hypothetical protein [Microvirga massiliensis]